MKLMDSKLTRVAAVVVVVAGALALFFWLYHPMPSAALKPLSNADSLFLYSIYPGKLDVPGPEDQARFRRLPDGSEELFHGNPVFGSVELIGSERSTVVSTFKQMTRFPGAPAKCFWPRHAIRAVRGDVITDYVICFQCNQGRVTTEGSSGWSGEFGITRSCIKAEATLKAILRSHGVPLPSH